MNKIVYIRCTEIYNDSRASKEICSLIDAGYYVEVVLWNRNGRAKQECENTFLNYADNISFHMFDCIVHNGIGLKNIDLLFKWFAFVKQQLNLIENIYAVHACDLDCGVPAHSFCKKNNIPLIYDIYDYYIDSHNIPPVLEAFVEKKEINVINSSRVVIICNEERRAQLEKSTPQKVVVIHNTPDISRIDQDESVITYDYAYCGRLSTIRLVKSILEDYPQNNDLNFIFCGEGEVECKEVAQKLSHKFDSFEYRDAIPYSSVLSIEKKSLCLSAIYDPRIRNHKLCAPNKFYEALALGKPIIVCRGTGIDKLVEKYNLGKVIDYSANEFYEAVKYFKKNPQLCKTIGENAVKLYNSRYSWDIMKEILVQTYDDINNGVDRVIDKGRQV